MCDLGSMPSRILTVPTSISSRPCLACPGSRREHPSCRPCLAVEIASASVVGVRHRCRRADQFLHGHIRECYHECAEWSVITRDVSYCIGLPHCWSSEHMPIVAFRSSFLVTDLS